MLDWMEIWNFGVQVYTCCCVNCFTLLQVSLCPVGTDMFHDKWTWSGHCIKVTSTQWNGRFQGFPVEHCQKNRLLVLICLFLHSALRCHKMTDRTVNSRIRWTIPPSFISPVLQLLTQDWTFIFSSSSVRFENVTCVVDSGTVPWRVRTTADWKYSHGNVWRCTT